ncbi:uncharacterized protein [Ptychodera flava]|uniref:uncharacterized protein n=1 Tax=Ptychodera flava TaxID=63121 RepID=UPI00396A85AD
MPKKVQPLHAANDRCPSVLIVNDKWRYPLQGNASAIIRLLLFLTEGIRKNVYSTVLYADDRAYEEAGRLGVELILPTPPGVLQFDKPTIGWLMGHKAYYESLSDLHDVKIVIGFEMTTSDAALDIRNKIFRQAAFYLINTVDPEMVDCRLMQTDENVVSHRRTQLKEEVKQAEVIVSAEPTTYCCVDAHATTQIQFHLPPLPKGVVKHSGVRKPYKDNKGEFRIVSPVEPHQLADNFHLLKDIAAAMETAAEELCKVFHNPPRWIIFGVSSDNNESFKAKFAPNCSHFKIVTYDYDYGLEDALRESNLVLFPSHSLDSLGVSRTAMALAIPVLFVGKSQRQFIKEEDNLEFTPDINCKLTELPEKLIYAIKKHTKCINKAKKVRKTLLKEVEVQKKTNDDFISMVKADIVALNPRTRTRTLSDKPHMEEVEDGTLSVEERHTQCPSVFSSSFKSLDDWLFLKDPSDVRRESDESLSVEERSSQYLADGSLSPCINLEDWVFVKEFPDVQREQGSLEVKVLIGNCIPAAGRTLTRVALAFYNLPSWKTTLLEKLLGSLPGIYILTIRPGSITYIMAFRTLKALEHLWSEYQSKRLGQLVERSILTDDVLAEVGARYLTVKTIIDPEEYLQCKEELRLKEGNRFDDHHRRHSMHDELTDTLFDGVDETMSRDPVDDLAVIRPPYKKKKAAMPRVGVCATLIGAECVETASPNTIGETYVLRTENRILKSRINTLERKLVILEREKQAATAAPRLTLRYDTYAFNEPQAVPQSSSSAATSLGAVPNITESSENVKDAEEEITPVPNQGDAPIEASGDTKVTHQEDYEPQGYLVEEDGINFWNVSWSKPWILKFSPGLSLNHENSLIIVHRDENTLVIDPWDEREGLGIFTFDEFPRPTIPWDVAVSPGGNYYVTDIANRRVVVCDKENKVINTFGQNEEINPRGIAFTLDGNVVLTDFNGDFLRKYSLNGEHKAVFGGTGSEPGQFSKPYSLAVNSRNEMIVSDNQNHRIQVLNSDGDFVTQFGNEKARPGELWFPKGVSVDVEDNVYVCDFGNNRVAKYNSDYEYLYNIARILCPIDIAVNSTDEFVFVTDLPNQCIKRCGMGEAGDLIGLFLEFLLRRFGLQP